MPALAVHARFTARAGRADELLAAIDAMFAVAAEEPGTRIYAVHRDRHDDHAVVMYELYDSDDALDAHGASDAAARFGAALEDLLASEPEVWFTRPVKASGLALDQRGGGSGAS